MAQDFYTMTPGSAVADTLQQILQRRRAESRQAMLDKLEEEQVRSQMAAQTRGLDLEEQRTQDAALTNEMQRRATQQQMTLKDLETVQDDTAIGSLTPERQAAARQYGMTAKQPGSMVQKFGSAEEMAATPYEIPESTEVFRSPERQKFYQGQEDLDTFLGQNQEMVKDYPELAQLLRARAGTGQDVPIPAEAVQLPGSLRVVDYRGNVGPSIPTKRGEQIVQTPQPYQMPAWSAPIAYQAFDKAGRLLYTTPALDRQAVTMFMQENPDVILRPLGFQPTNQAGADRLTQAINQLRQAASGGFDPDDINAARSAILSSRDLTPNTQQALTTIVQRMRSGTRLPTQADVPAAVAAVQVPFRLTEEDAASLREILDGYLSVPLE